MPSIRVIRRTKQIAEIYYNNKSMMIAAVVELPMELLKIMED